MDENVNRAITVGLRQRGIDVIYARQLRITIGECIHDLELVAEATEPEELVDTVLHLPL